MASNIREVMHERPGIRVLVVVGASHKGYLEAYLNQMHDARIVDAALLLR
jgi:pheromone shutdown protein TraB